MAISLLKDRSTGDTIVADDDDAEWQNIIDEVNTHTAVASPHTNHVITTGDTMTGELAINISGTSTCLDLDSAATTGDIFELNGDSLTTGGLMDIVSNSAETDTRTLVDIVNDNTAATGATCFRIQQDSTGNIAEFYDGGSLISYIDDEGAFIVGSG